MTGIYLVSILFLGLSFLVSSMLKGRFAKYSKVALANGMSGAEVAQKMLRDNGIYDVEILQSQGMLSDHYHPIKRTVNLSPEVFAGRSVAAAAVAAHECGHAVQHATAYPWLMMRSRLVPVVQFSSGIVQWILLAGVILVNSFPQLLIAGIALFALTTLFSVITLPVEFDASRRALAWLQQTNITSGATYTQAKDALKWAALTYVVAALASIATLVQYILIFLGGRRDD